MPADQNFHSSDSQVAEAIRDLTRAIRDASDWRSELKATEGRIIKAIGAIPSTEIAKETAKLKTSEEALKSAVEANKP